jgi:hypothetical protein
MHGSEKGIQIDSGEIFVDGFMLTVVKGEGLGTK